MNRFTYIFIVLILLFPVSMFTNLPEAEGAAISFDAVATGSSGGGGATSFTISSTIASGASLLFVGVSIRTTTVSVTYISVGGTVNMTKAAANNYGTSSRLESWFLYAPPSGSQTITVYLSASVKSAGGATSYFNTGAGIGGLIKTGTSTTAIANCSQTLSGQLLIINYGWQNVFTVSAHNGGQTDRWTRASTGGLASSRSLSHGDDIINPTGTGYKQYNVTVSSSADWITHCITVNPIYYSLLSTTSTDSATASQRVTYTRRSSAASTDSATLGRAVTYFKPLTASSTDSATAIATYIAHVISTYNVFASALSDEVAAFSRSLILPRLSSASSTDSTNFARQLQLFRSNNASELSLVSDWNTRIMLRLSGATDNVQSLFNRNIEASRIFLADEISSSTLDVDRVFNRFMNAVETVEASFTGDYIAYTINTFYIFLTSTSNDATVFTRTVIFERPLAVLSDDYIALVRSVDMARNFLIGENGLASLTASRIFNRILNVVDNAEASFIGTFIPDVVNTYYVFADALSSELASFTRTFGGGGVTITVSRFFMQDNGDMNIFPMIFAFLILVILVAALLIRRRR